MSSNATLTLDDVRNRATITVPEAARLLGVNRNTAYRMAKAGELPVYRAGKLVFVAVPALLRQLGDVESAA